jgi:hypothetical protein
VTFQPGVVSKRTTPGLLISVTLLRHRPEAQSKLSYNYPFVPRLFDLHFFVKSSKYLNHNAAHGRSIAAQCLPFLGLHAKAAGISGTIANVLVHHSKRKSAAKKRAPILIYPSAFPFVC